MRKMKISLMAMALVAVLYSLSSAGLVTIDSVQITATDGSKVYVLVTQDVVDSLRQANKPGSALEVLSLLRENEKIVAAKELVAQKAVDDSIAAVQRAITDSLAEAEERRNFWPNVQAAMTEIPEDFDSVLFWADTPVRITAVLLKYDIPKTWIEANLANIDGYGEELITAAAMNYAQTRNMLHRYAVELNGPAHRKLIEKDSVLSQDIFGKADQACLDETNTSLKETREAVELTFQLATVNTANIETLVNDINTLKRSVWTVMEGLKRAKIRNNQGDDNRRMMESLSAQATTAVESTQLKSNKL